MKDAAAVLRPNTSWDLKSYPGCGSQGDRLEDDWVPQEDARPLEEIEAATRKEEARNRCVGADCMPGSPAGSEQWSPANLSSHSLCVCLHPKVVESR